MNPSLPSIFTTEALHRVNSADLDAFISAHYGVEFDFAENSPASDGPWRLLHLTPRPHEQLDAYDQEIFDLFLQGHWGGYNLASLVLGDLCGQGALPEGWYLILLS